MKRFVFDFDLDIWMQNIVIEADNYEEAKKQLLEITAEELVEKGYVKDFNIKEIDCEEYEDDLSEEE